MTPEPPSPAPPEPPQPAGPSFRRLFHVVTILFLIFLVVRTLVVEPFGVTTGSMAETIHGNRREAPCPRCGAAVCVGSPDESRASQNPQLSAYCWNCGKEKIDLTQLANGEVMGDRIMVDKLVYKLRDPVRWEVAVFRCPVDSRKPYVKRVVGLPGEAFRIFDGDAYANGVLLRKTLAQIHEVRIPVFSMIHVANTGGWAERWEVGPLAEVARMPATKPKLPSVADVVQQDRLVLDATETPFGLTYRHRDLDSKRDSSVRDRLSYNGGPSHRVWLPVHDFIVSFEVKVLAGVGSLALRLDDGADRVVVDLPIGGGAGRIGPEAGTATEFTLHSALAVGQRHRIEFAFVDRRIFLTVDGREVLEPLDVPVVPAKLTTDPAGKRLGTERPLQLGVRGVSVVLHDLTLSRDIHYRSEDEDAVNATRSPLQLGPKQYFLMGDNSASSSDSRVWEIPTVDRSAFLGKPFFVHQPLKHGNVPLFGAVQTLDWHRLRFLE